MSTEREQLRGCASTADTFALAADAGDKVRAAVGWYIQQYRAAPYDSREFMQVINRILGSKFGEMMLGGDRQRLLGLAARAVDVSKDVTKRKGRPPHPEEILQVAAYLADVEHDENGKALTLERQHYEDGKQVGADQAYQSAFVRLSEDFGIVVKPETIKKFRERDNKK